MTSYVTQSKQANFGITAFTTQHETIKVYIAKSFTIPFCCIIRIVLNYVSTIRRFPYICYYQGEHLVRQALNHCFLQPVPTLQHLKTSFFIECIVTRLLSESEAKVDLVLIQTFLLSYVNHA